MNQLAELIRQRLDQSLRSNYFERRGPGALSRRKNIGAALNTERMRASSDSGESQHAERRKPQSPPAVSSEVSLSNVTSVLARYQPSGASAGASKQSASGKVSATNADVIIGTACLELSVLSLREQIYEFGCRLIAAGVTELKLLPIFLMAGVHVMEDIPAEIEAARQQLGDDIVLTVCDHLGSHPNISTVLEKRFSSEPAESSLLVAHGSRRPKGNKGIEKLAKQLNTQVAYWAIPPDIETQVIELMQQGYQKLTILPYFLFAGGITDAIAHRTEELAERFPRVQFRLLPTLGATAEIADLSVEIIQSV